MINDIVCGSFIWDPEKERLNIERLGVDFSTACEVFLDPDCLILDDPAHSQMEHRYFGIGLVQDHVITVRFTFRGDIIRVFGAGAWRKGRKLYETQKEI